MRPIRELLDDEVCEEIDRWVAGAEEGTTRVPEIRFSGSGEFAVNVGLFLHRGEGNVSYDHGYGATARKAFSIALARSLGADIDPMGNPNIPDELRPSEAAAE